MLIITVFVFYRIGNLKQDVIKVRVVYIIICISDQGLVHIMTEKLAENNFLKLLKKYFF